MSPLTEPTKLTLSRIQQYPAVLGEPWGGGYFAGYISHTADGNPTHALIVAPRATGATGTGYTLTTNLAWKTTATTTPGTTSLFDGLANTAAIVTAGIADHPAAQFCTGLSIGGFTDWYLPARHELDIAYFNLKPTTQANTTVAGANPYSVPRLDTNYTSSYPGQTYLPLFAGGSEAFTNLIHWTSTESGPTAAWPVNFADGNFPNQNKASVLIRVRAFRRIAL